LRKNYNKSIFFDQKLKLFIPKPPEKTSKPQEKPSALKKEHPPLQK
jgi:hypothetical protein